MNLTSTSCAARPALLIRPPAPPSSPPEPPTVARRYDTLQSLRVNVPSQATIVRTDDEGKGLSVAVSTSRWSAVAARKTGSELPLRLPPRRVLVARRPPTSRQLRP